jgi:23S rRNA pseudouridine1911/1915/1917 synthase
VTLRVLYEDNHCLAVDKPAGLLVQPDRTGDATLLDAARDDLRRRHQRPGNVFIAAVHRLDRPVSGIVLLARTSKAASRLGAQFRAGSVDKVYLALVEAPPAPPEGVLEHHLVKDPTTNRVRTANPGEPGARAARLAYRTLSRHSGGTLLEVRPDTGRSHQIRVQLAAAGAPIAGDLRYGSRRALGTWIALHAASLAFDHPTRPERLRLEAPLPETWRPLLGP